MLTPAQLDLGLALLAAHAMTDFVFQPDWMVKMKSRQPVLLLHSLIAAGLAYAFAGRWELWLLPAWVFLSHATIDFIKSRAARSTLRIFVVDQAAHLATVAVLAWWFTKAGDLSFWAKDYGPAVWRGWILITGAVLCVRVGGILIGFWVKPYLEEIERTNNAMDVAVKAVRGLTNGGRVIGQLERVLIFMLLGMGQPAGIGFLVAAKSIFRFGELKDRENRMEAEYITIGTLISFAWAIAASALAWWLARRV
jgi:hypothetical protein